MLTAEERILQILVVSAPNLKILKYFLHIITVWFRVLQKTYGFQACHDVLKTDFHLKLILMKMKLVSISSTARGLKMEQPLFLMRDFKIENRNQIKISPSAQILMRIYLF